MIASTQDIVLADKVHDAIAGHASSSSDDPRIYISVVWAALVYAGDADWFPIELYPGRHLDTRPWHVGLRDIKAWLVRASAYTDASGRPLVVLGCANLEQRIDTALAAASETVADGAVYHFVIDRVARADAYQPRTRVVYEPGLSARVVRR